MFLILIYDAISFWDQIYRIRDLGHFIDLDNFLSSFW